LDALPIDRPLQESPTSVVGVVGPQLDLTPSAIRRSIPARQNPLRGAVPEGFREHHAWTQAGDPFWLPLPSRIWRRPVQAPLDGEELIPVHLEPGPARELAHSLAACVIVMHADRRLRIGVERGDLARRPPLRAFV